MFEKKYRYQLSEDEYAFIIKRLIDLKNALIKQGRYTDAVDDLLIKLLNSNKRKARIFLSR